MDISQENCNEDLDSLSKDIPVLSEYAKVLETHVKRRYLQKISLVVVDPASIPSDQFNPECLPSIDEATDLFWKLVTTPSSSLNATQAWGLQLDGEWICYLCTRQDYRREACGSRESAPFPEDEWPTRKHLGYHWKRRHHFSSTLLGK